MAPSASSWLTPVVEDRPAYACQGSVTRCFSSLDSRPLGVSRGRRGAHEEPDAKARWRPPVRGGGWGMVERFLGASARCNEHRWLYTTADRQC
jgi:hypothetical protein